MKWNCGIYKITVLIKNKEYIYIGQSNNINVRWNSHLIAAFKTKEDLKVYSKMRSAGIENCKFEVLELCDEKDLDLRECYYIKQYESYKNGLNSTSGNHSELLNSGEVEDRREDYCYSMLKIPFKISEKILYIIKDELKYDLSKCKILCLGDNNLIEYFNYSGSTVTIIYNDSDEISYKYNNLKNTTLIKIEKSKNDLLKGVNQMPKDFDIIIANPPYDDGLCQNIMKEVITHGRETVCLMPESKYKTGLYKNVSKAYSVSEEDTSEFDANIGFGLLITVMNQNIKNQTFEDFKCMYKNPEVAEFFKLNYKSIKRYNYLSGPRIEEGKKFNIKTYFLCGVRTAAHGHLAYDKNTVDYKWNISKSISVNDLHIKIRSSGKQSYEAYNSIEFKTEVEKDNFTKFAFANDCRDSTFNLLLKENNSNSSIGGAIPNIDWSKDRDYEHATIGDLVKWLKEDNNLEN